MLFQVRDSVDLHVQRPNRSRSSGVVNELSTSRRACNLTPRSLLKDPLGLHHSWWHSAYQGVFSAGRATITAGRKIVRVGGDVLREIGDGLRPIGCTAKSLLWPLEPWDTPSVAFEGGTLISSAAGRAISYAGVRGVP